MTSEVSVFRLLGDWFYLMAIFRLNPKVAVVMVVAVVVVYTATIVVIVVAV